jgi:cyclophilin family peptidyl-prolyl cis-trans isomerase
MPKENPVIVMSQLDGSGGQESCGYHTLKNTLLSMMRTQNLINESQFQSMVKDKKLFGTLFAATKQ